LNFQLRETKIQEPVVYSNENNENLEELMKIIAAKAFEFNPFPIILKFEHEGMSKTSLDTAAKIIREVFDDQLYLLPSNFMETEVLPSPSELKKRVLVMSHVSPKFLKANQKDIFDESLEFFKIVSLLGSKLDFEFKGQFSWNFCALEDSKVHKLEYAEDEALSNYTKRMLVIAGPTPEKGTEVNRDTSGISESM
jgi:hypothetical protein